MQRLSLVRDNDRNRLPGTDVSELTFTQRRIFGAHVAMVFQADKPSTRKQKKAKAAACGGQVTAHVPRKKGSPCPICKEGNVKQCKHEWGVTWEDDDEQSGDAYPGGGFSPFLTTKEVQRDQVCSICQGKGEDGSIRNAEDDEDTYVPAKRSKKGGGNGSRSAKVHNGQRVTPNKLLLCDAKQGCSACAHVRCIPGSDQWTELPPKWFCCEACGR